jgi:two-component system NtrC family response regulator
MQKTPKTPRFQRIKLLQGGKGDPGVPESWDRPEEEFYEPQEVEMIGTCPAMRQVFHLIRQVAATGVPVLITGARGTGKEMVARALHQRSLLAEGPFVAITPGAVPPEFLAAELFGQAKGVLGSTRRAARGKLELAHRGTLLLDEVGELPLEVQDKLLNFLQDFILERVGGAKRLRLDLRLMAASSRDLWELVAAGRFREALYLRLAAATIALPDLKDRGDDVLLMACVFLQRYAAQVGKELYGFTSEALQALQCYGWPGNIRELISHIRRAVVLAVSPWVTPENLGLEAPAADEGLEPNLGLKEALARYEARLLTEALAQCQGNVALAAKTLKTNPSLVSRLIKKYGLKPHAYLILLSCSLAFLVLIWHQLTRTFT